MKNKDLTEAIPPDDYSGSVGKWINELQKRGLWDGKNPEWYADFLAMVPYCNEKNK